MADDKTPKTYDDLAGTNRGTYEEAVVSTRLRSGGLDDAPKPDTPYGAAVHVNPALTPPPAWSPPPDRVVVPVINDPGVLAAAPSLADLNRAALTSYGVPEAEDAEITEEAQQQQVTAAAEARQEKLNEAVAANADEAAEASEPQPAARRSKSSKIGSASAKA